MIIMIVSVKTNDEGLFSWGKKDGESEYVSVSVCVCVWGGGESFLIVTYPI